MALHRPGEWSKTPHVDRDLVVITPVHNAAGASMFQLCKCALDRTCALTQAAVLASAL